MDSLNKDNQIGVRLIRTDPIQDDFGRLHYDSLLRNTEADPENLLKEDCNTVVISNAPFWCTYITLEKLCIDCSKAGLS